MHLTEKPSRLATFLVGSLLAFGSGFVAWFLATLASLKESAPTFSFDWWANLFENLARDWCFGFIVWFCLVFMILGFALMTMAISGRQWRKTSHTTGDRP